MSTYRLKGASGAVINQAFTLGTKTLIGSADDCDLRIENNGIEPRHAEITEEAGYSCIEKPGERGRDAAQW